MQEFFVVANSCAGPFFSDESKEYVTGPDPLNTLSEFVNGYRHPYKLFAAAIYASADDYHKGRPPLARWTSNKAANRQGDPHAGKFTGAEADIPAMRREHQL